MRKQDRENVIELTEARARVAKVRALKLNPPLAVEAFRRIWGQCLDVVLALKKKASKGFGKEEGIIRRDVYSDLLRRFRQFGLPVTVKEVEEWPIVMTLLAQLEKDLEVSERSAMPLTRGEVYVLLGALVHAIETEQHRAVFAMARNEDLGVEDPKEQMLMLKRLTLVLNRFVWRMPDQFDADHERVKWGHEEDDPKEVARGYKRLRTWALSGIDTEVDEEEPEEKASVSQAIIDEEFLEEVEMATEPKDEEKPKKKRKARARKERPEPTADDVWKQEIEDAGPPEDELDEMVESL